MSDSYSMREQIAKRVCKDYFDGSTSLFGKILKDLSKYDAAFLSSALRVLGEQRDYISLVVARKEKAGARDGTGFRTGYGKWRYIFAIVQRQIREDSELY